MSSAGAISAALLKCPLGVATALVCLRVPSIEPMSGPDGFQMTGAWGRRRLPALHPQGARLCHNRLRGLHISPRVARYVQMFATI